MPGTADRPEPESREGGGGPRGASLGEFELIRKHLTNLAATCPGALGLRDDAAVLTPPGGRDLVLCADALVEGVHFLPDDPADLVARKPAKVVAVAVANRIARTAWVLMARGGTYRPPAITAA